MCFLVHANQGEWISELLCVLLTQTAVKCTAITAVQSGLQTSTQRHKKDVTILKVRQDGKLKGMNDNQRRRITNLQAEVVAMKSRMESLLLRRAPNSPDYQEYQNMRRISKTTAPLVSSSLPPTQAQPVSSGMSVPRNISASLPKEIIAEITPATQQVPSSVTITVK